jgi:ribonuclease E
MLGAAARFLPVIRNFTRQIIPPVVATLLAAVLIAGYNRAFVGHLVQPRMGMLHGDVIGTDEAPRPAGTATAKLREATDAIVVAEPVSVHNRVFSKDSDREAAKDDTALKTAAAPAVEPVAVEAAAPAAQAAPAVSPAPPVARAPARKADPRVVERRPVEPRPVGVPVVVAQPPVILAQPPMAAPAPVIATAPLAAPYPGYPMQPPVAQEPPAVISAKPIVTVPDRPRAAYPQNAPYEAAAPEREIAAPPPPQGGPLERFVDTVKPSSIFARMRELGERIEAAGNDILPSIRQ